MKKVIKIVLFMLYFVGTFSKKPNIIFILTDDQDSEMDSLSAMPKLLSLIGDKGATFTNSFVASPLCCPSRSGILTGKYVHNHGTVNNSVEGNCNSRQWQVGPETEAFPLSLKSEGYTTFFAGKYLNNYGFENVGGLSHIPPGWSSWIGLKGNAVYYNYTLSVNGTPVFHGDNPDTDYLTNVIKNESVKFIESYVNPKPFFMMLSTPACHDPITPEPQYETSLNLSIPRNPNFNIENIDKNWFVQLGEQPLNSEIVDSLDEIYRNRLRTLLSVDDMVESVVEALENKGILDNTFIFFTSDHGYHLGQFSLSKDKRLPYEFDIKVPLLVRGPGVPEGIEINDVVTNIDLAPTFLDLAGSSIPVIMDGTSFKESLLNKDPFDPAMIERSLLIEHSGEGYWYPQTDCEYLGKYLAYCELRYDCKCQDASNNTYSCVRTVGTEKNELYCYWNDYEFEEYYDITIDPYQLNNTVSNLTTVHHLDLKQKLNILQQCSGASCNNLNEHKW